MRQIGEINGRGRADRFLNFLAAQGIPAEALDEKDGRLSIWVINEDHLVEAEQHFVSFKVSPDAAVFNAPPQSKTKPKLKASAKRSRYIDVRSEIFGRNALTFSSVTVLLITASVLLTLLSSTPSGAALKPLLYYSEFMGNNFGEIRDGQIWRLVTPIFLHAGFIHLLFNMLWVYQLGGAIEVNEGRFYLLGFTVVFAAIVNTAQYIVSGPAFLGFSGVAYAYLGYVWMMSRYQPATRYSISRDTVVMMVVWIVVCYTGLLGPVANTEHVAGFVSGTAFGFLRSGYFMTVIRRSRFKR